MGREVTFRPLTEPDVPLMHRWLNEPHVRRWYHEYDGSEPTIDRVRRDYVDEREGAEMYVIVVDGRDAGYIQTYVVGDTPEYARAIGVTERAAGIDAFVGEPDLVHRGVGPEAIRRFVETVVFADPTIEACVVGPEVNNASAIRAYEKAGFVALRTAVVPGEPEPELVMRRGR